MEWVRRNQPANQDRMAAQWLLVRTDHVPSSFLDRARKFSCGSRRLSDSAFCRAKTLGSRFCLAWTLLGCCALHHTGTLILVRYSFCIREGLGWNGPGKSVHRIPGFAARCCGYRTENSARINGFTPFGPHNLSQTGSFIPFDLYVEAKKWTAPSFKCNPCRQIR